MSWLARVRLGIGEIASWFLARLFSRPWAQRSLAHGLDQSARVSLVDAAARYAACPAELAHAALRYHPRSGSPELLELALERLEAEPETLAYAQKLFGTLHEWLSRHAGGVPGKRILELGPGHTLVPGALLLAAGAERWVGIDRFPIASHDARVYRKLRDALAHDRGLVRSDDYYRTRERALERFDSVVRLDGERVAFDETRLSWQAPVDAAALPFPDASFDVCLSNASFEHFKEPERAVRESLRVVAPGGFSIHQIDLRDHRDFTKPIDFLKFSDVEWQGFFADVSFIYTNRWRRDDFLGAFRSAGGEVVRAEANMTVPLTDELRASLAPRFRDRAREDLETVSLFLVVRRASGA
jgi:SAM-dependent methyltransferase